jgi:Fe-S oxidoreductase
MSMISAGDLVPARRIAEHNVRELAEAARDGHTIVCTEPSAALCLSQEYPRLLDHPDVNLVGAQAIEAGAFLLKLHRAGEFLTEFEPLDLDVGYHTPCHLRALTADSPLRELLSLIPELRVHTMEEGCSGMAGAWGTIAPAPCPSSPVVPSAPPYRRSMFAPAMSRFRAVETCSAAICCAGVAAGAPTAGRPAWRTCSSTEVICLWSSAISIIGISFPLPVNRL